jgi:hypothetical protein
MKVKVSAMPFWQGFYVLQYVTQHHEMSRFAHLRKVRKREKQKPYMMYFVKIDQLQYPDMTTALQTCHNINAHLLP